MGQKRLSRRKIEKLGRIVREEVRKWAKHNYSVDVDNMCGACAIASMALKKTLKATGVAPGAQFVCAMTDEDDDSACGHCWVEVGSWVVDVTATQFGDKDEVVIVRKSEYPYKDDFPVEARGRRAEADILFWERQSPALYSKQMNALARRMARVSL